MEPWRGLHGLTVLCFLMHARGQRDFDLADALDDPEPTKKPNSGYFNDGDRNDGHYPPRPRPPAVIYPTLKPRPQPQPGNSGNSGGYFNDGDRNDGHYPPRPRPPAGWRTGWKHNGQIQLEAPRKHGWAFLFRLRMRKRGWLCLDTAPRTCVLSHLRLRKEGEPAGI
ncbi:glycoprotein Xg [Saimiri boliviensis]|uniref:glycoprotein Xg n=1 Tax=Saimiri boliviensis TaxID=27679 RepID=UPI003D7709C6